jgi:hypothetical protein
MILIQDSTQVAVRVVCEQDDKISKSNGLEIFKLLSLFNKLTRPMHIKHMIYRELKSQFDFAAMFFFY